jgi:hypothetical protein
VLPAPTCTGEMDPLVVVDDPAMTGSNAGLSDDLTISSIGDCFSFGFPAPDQVFELVVPGELETLDIDTTGSSFDTIMDIRFDDCANAPLACNDQDPDGGATTSAIQLSDVAPGTYFIMVEGWFGETGTINLNVNGVVKSGQACDPAAESAGYLVCENGTTCQGTAMAETCQP